MSRRDLIANAAASTALVGSARGATVPAVDIARDLGRYIDFGVKAAGGPGDVAAGAWLEQELTAAGFTCSHQSFVVPWFEADRAELTSSEHRAAVIPQAIVVPTGPDGVSGPLVLVEDSALPPGAIVIVDLPYARWSSALHRAVREPVMHAVAAGAVAVVIVTTGPSGEALALNAPGDKPLADRPVAILAPRDAAPFLDAARKHAPARLLVTGKGGRRPAFNLVGRLDRGRGRWLIVSTPRSGWFTCAGERGPGVAIWLDLARWAATNLISHDLAFICTSGHEYENLGAKLVFGKVVPSPKECALWIALGANVAARDWHELPHQLLPLPSADPQRFLVASPDLVPLARRAFAGQPGLEMPYPASAGAEGELKEILAAGYARTLGVFGAHRFHHAAGDTLESVYPALVTRVAASFRALIATSLTLN